MIEILVMIYQVGALLIIINLTTIIVMIYRVGTLLIIINITTIMIYQVGILLI